MKKLLITSIGSICFLLIIVSCHKSGMDDIHSVSQLIEKRTDSDSTEIAQMEREQGYEFVKQDITLKDKASRNTVVVRLAAKSQNDLDKYLGVYQIGLKTISAYDKKLLSKGGDGLPKSDNEVQKPASDYANSSPVYIEEIYSSLEPGVSYSIDFSIKKQLEEARVSAYMYSTVFISSDWPEELWMTRNSSSNSFDFTVEYKAGSIFASYYDPCCLYLLDPSFPPAAPPAGNDWNADTWPVSLLYRFHVDGPKKVRLTIRYNVFSAFTVGFQQI